MKHRLFHLFVLMALLAALAGAHSVSAQGPTPPKPPIPRHKQPDKLSLQHRAPATWAEGERSAPAQDRTSAANASPAALALGPSGTSFSYAATIGETAVPYLPDGEHLFTPAGMFMDASNNLYVTEEYGSRLLKFNSAGTNTLIIGDPGNSSWDNGYLVWPEDVTVRSGDGHIFVAMWSAIKEFDADGNEVRTFPETDPGDTGDGNDRLNDPYSLAFGPGGYLYVADTGNARIQILDFGESVTYVGTIGTPGTPQSDDTGFYRPMSIAFDSLGRLYVADSDNSRVQRCESSDPWTDWTCSTFYGEAGVYSGELGYLEWPTGITVSSDDLVYIVDGDAQQVVECDTSMSCRIFAGETDWPSSDDYHFRYPRDVAVNSTGDVFVSDGNNSRVQIFDSEAVYQDTIGVNGVPYITDNYHLYTPGGITAGPSDEVYVTEQDGYRLIKYNAAGTAEWSVGQSAMCSGGLEYLCSPYGDPAVAANGNVYVSEAGYSRIRIFNASGADVGIIGTGDWNTGPYDFKWPLGIAIHPTSGDIFVADSANDRVQVFTSAGVHKKTIGETGVWGSDNLHFDGPQSVAVDTAGNIYVADLWNNRVQKCMLTAGLPGYSCTTFAGVTGQVGTDFSHLYPASVEVDASGRVYVADGVNNRVQVFNSSGAYLTTIGGNFGQGTAQFSYAAGVAVDSSGNVYVTDNGNARVQKFSPGTTNWTQVNINGFGDPLTTGASSLVVFNNNLYAASWSNGAKLWRSSDGTTWSPFMTNSFGDPTNDGIFQMIVFNNKLYAATIGACTDVDCLDFYPGQLWRTDGTSWEQAVADGFGSTTNWGINALAVFSGNLYAATVESDGTARIYRSSSGNLGSWGTPLTTGFGGVGIAQDIVMDTYNGYLYVGFGRNGTAELWRCQLCDGTDWDDIFIDGLAANNTNVSSMAAYNGAFYIGLRNVTTGGQLWKSTNGATFTKVFDSGLGSSGNYRPYGLQVFGGSLYLTFSNLDSGGQVWRSPTGSAGSWTQVGFGGFGDANNGYINYADKGATVFGGRLYIGTINAANGGEIWRFNEYHMFNDVPVAGKEWMEPWIVAFRNAGVTTGCGMFPDGLHYCPENNVTRAEMAVFLLRAKHGAGYTPPAAAHYFSDMPVAGKEWMEPWVDQYFREGLTTGCGGGNFCPENNVTRAEMAVFVLRALHPLGYQPPAVTNPFSDVPVAGKEWMEPWIIDFKNHGITTGCGGGNYCPENNVTRAEMAVFIGRAYHLYP